MASSVIQKFSSNNGTVYSATDASEIEVSASTTFTKCSLTLAQAGTYVVEGRIRYTDTGTGRRFVAIRKSQSVSTNSDHTSSFYKGTNSPVSYSICCVMSISANDTVNLLGYSDVETIATHGYLFAVRIG